MAFGFSLKILTLFLCFASLALVVIEPNTMSANYSLTDLPVEVLEQILLFVPTPRALCRIGTTCSSLSRLLMANERVEQSVWGSLYRKRWKYGNWSPLSTVTISCRTYKTSHVLDDETLKLLLEMSKNVERERDYGLGSPRSCKGPVWEKLCTRYYSFDLVRSIANKHPSVALLYPTATKSVTLVTRCVATMLLDFMHFQKAANELRELLRQSRVGPIESLYVAEEGALLLMESQRTWDELLVLESSPWERRRAAQIKLDELASELQDRMDNFMGENVTPLDTVELLSTMLVDDKGFSKSTTHDNADKASIEHVLEAKNGFPMTVALISQSILRRVGVSVTIACISDHAVLGLPEKDEFVDILRDCGRLLLGDLQSQAVTMWGPTSDMAMTGKHVVASIIADDLAPCYAASRYPVRTTKIWNASYKTTFLDKVWSGSNIENKRHRYPYMDPAIWRHYNLINDNTFWRHTEAPYYHAESESENS